MITFTCNNNPLTVFPSSFPNTLQSLNCATTQRSSLPALPNTLLSLDCSYNQFVTLPALPAGLTQLYCAHNLLNALPALPNLTQSSFDCSYNQLSSLPSLSHLTFSTLNCSHNQLTALPNLPNSFYQLNCSYNAFTSLSSLLNTEVSYLECSHNLLTSLHTFHSGLNELYCSYNQLTIIPTGAMPASLSQISCRNNPNLTCIGILPNSLYSLNYGNSPMVCVPNIPNGLYMNPSNLPVCTFGNAGTCFLYPKISGKLYADIDNSGTRNAGDIDIPNKVVSNAADTTVGSTDANGDYDFLVDNNTAITFEPRNVIQNFTLSPSSRTLTTGSGFGLTYPNQDFRLIPNALSPDLQVFMTVNGVFRPGFETLVTLTYRNVGAEVLNGTVTFTLDNALTYTSSSPSGTPSGNVITWGFTNLGLFQEGHITVLVGTPIPLPLGTIVQNTISGAISAGTDTNLADNQEIGNSTVVGSYDPNDKTADRQYLTPAQFANGEPITYAIRFQNTGNYPASKVEIQDTLSSDFDISTLKTLATSHAGWALEVVKNGFGLQPIVLKWIFDPIFDRNKQ